MRVLIADKLASDVITQLEKSGCSVLHRPDTTAEELVQAAADVEILIVRSTEVRAAVIEQAKCLSLIVRAGAGVNTIDVEAASRRGVYVANCPGVNSVAVAELTMGLLIAADRRIPDATADLRAGRWRKKEYGKARGLKGRTLGLIGYGSIGKAVAARAAAFEMRVVAWSRSLTPEKAAEFNVICLPSPLEVARQSDAVSIHLALTPDTKHLIGPEFLAAMKEGAILVNTSRGALVQTAALREAIRSKGLKAAVDVFEGEPEGGEAAFSDVELAQHLIGTPHIGASTDQTSEAIGREVVRMIHEYLQTGTVPGAVNTLERTPATHTLVVRHYNRVGVLATILDGLRAERINVEEMQNRIFKTAEAAVCTLALDAPPSEEFLKRLGAEANILQVTLGAHS